MANVVFRISATMLQDNSEAQGHSRNILGGSDDCHAGFIILSFPFLLKCFVKKIKILTSTIRKNFWVWSFLHEKYFDIDLNVDVFWKIQISQIFYFLIDYDILRNLTTSFNGTYISLKTFRISLLFRDGMQSIAYAGQTLPLNHILAFFRVSAGCVLFLPFSLD